MSSLTFLGDVYLPRPARVTADLGPNVVFNLEHPITRSHAGVAGKINLKAESNHILATFDQVPTAVSLANNHVMDYGAQGLADTQKVLGEAGIRYFGAGAMDEPATNGLIVDAGGVPVGLVGAACPSTGAIVTGPGRVGACALSADRIAASIASLRRDGAERVVAVVHWGAEEVHLPKPEDVALARAMIDAGADLIIGHHSHCIQPYEVYRGRYVFYGLGNCVMPDLDEPAFFHDGRPTVQFRKRQRAWNRASIAVHYRPDSGTSCIQGLTFRDGVLRAARHRAPRMAVTDSRAYAGRFRRAYAFGKLRAAAANFVTNPKMPAVRHARFALAVLRDREYR